MEAINEKATPYTPGESSFWRITIALMLASFSIFSTLYVFQPLLPVFASQLNISATESSYLMSSCVLAMVMGLFVLGFLADRYGRSLVMKGSLLITALSLLALPLTASFEWMVVLRFVQGFFLAGIPAAAMGYLGEEMSHKHLGLAMTLYISSNALGGMGGRVVGGYLTDIFDWRITIWSFGVFGFLTMISFMFMFPKERFFKKTDQRMTEDLRGMLVHLKNVHMLVLFLLGVLLQVVFTAIWTYIPFHLNEEPFSWSLKSISFTYFAYVFGVLAPPIAGRFSDAIGLKKVMFTGVLILIAGVFFTAIPSEIFIMIGLSLICMGFFVAHSMAAALVSKSATHHRSGASGFYLISYYLGVAIGSTAVGTLWEKFEWYGVLSVTTFLIFLFIFLPFYKNE
ncbi:MFS transporter, YNFM family, putative membrane transport protein [Halobacillus dabanensis]|uniref:MFS transporter, YNFM family, putative membrane transport protein n=1 Tax=Halobacillus dabanensis TaxID=240302 RepID=A0A1I3R0Z5_HALDA|nr:MFS transporter [Halobacillus dabanensis]SFJ39037.1 MFS transporter, YNFM family, putative membrane transport protein [Halobacillus dabanensis]